jgi:hypothetical protein
MTMIGWLNVVFVAVVVASVLFLFRSKLVPEREEFGPRRFYARKPLSTPEQILYFRLVKALPEHIVLAQVQLSRFLDVESGQHAWGWRNRISQKSADFVVCRKDATVVAVIELDDVSHERGDRRAADATKEEALAAAGIKVIRWPETALPDGSAINAAFPADAQPGSASEPVSRRGIR